MKSLTKFTVVFCAFGLVLAGSTGTSRAEELKGYGPIPGEKMYAGTAYRSGGLGIDEREVLEKFEYQYSLKLVFSVDNGVYMAKVPVIIKDWAGKTILEATSRGPWLYVRLPAGKYSVEAWNHGDKKTMTVRVGASGLTTVYMRW